MRPRWSLLRHALRRRRRRFWKYVSPRRHGAGLLILALLSSGVYLYWYFANDWQVRRQAEEYLIDLTGGHVRIGKADFSIYGKLELEDVVLRVPGDPSPDALLKARKVVLRHRPLELFFRGRLDVTEIVFMEPVVTVEYDTDRRRFENVERLIQLARRRRDRDGPSGIEQLPPVHVRNGLVRVFERPGRRLLGETNIGMALLPRGADRYKLEILEKGALYEGTQTRGVIEVIDGELRLVDYRTTGSIPEIVRLLPTTYGQWLRDHFKAGRFSTTYQGEQGEKADRIALALEEAAMVLPEEYGGYALTGLSGRIVFEREAIGFEEVSGRLEQGEGRSAGFRLDGVYRGYEADAPFEVAVDLTGLGLQPMRGDSPLAATFNRRLELWRPSGEVDLRMSVKRDADGDLSAEGAVALNGISARYAVFPYPVRNLKGLVRFDDELATFDGLTGENGPMAVTIGGWVRQRDDGEVFDVRIGARDLPLDDRLLAAVPPGAARAWKDLRPRGEAHVQARVTRPDPSGHDFVTITVLKDSDFSVAHRRLPYRMDVVDGAFQVVGRDVLIGLPETGPDGRPERPKAPIRTRRGEATCELHGWVLDADTDRQRVDMRFKADRVPLDDALAGALGESSRKALDSLNAVGEARDVSAELTQTGDEDVDYSVTCRLDDLAFRYEDFPYAVTDAGCRVRITPGRVRIRDLDGRHGNAKIRLGCTLFTEDVEGGGLRLAVDVLDMALDEDLYAALGPRMRAVWDRMRPAGTADVSIVRLEENTPRNPGSLDYEIVMLPKSMTVGAAGLPYRFAVRQGRKPDEGLIVFTPGRVSLRTLESPSSAEAPRLRSLSGEARYDDHSVRIDLAFQADGLPLDAKRLQAMPDWATPITSRLTGGGTMDLDLSKLEMDMPVDGAATRPATAPATRPAGDGMTWALAGEARLKDVGFDVGLDECTASGTFRGTAERTAEGLSVDGAIEKMDVHLGDGRRVSGLNARVRNRGETGLSVEDLSAKVYGGRLAGRAAFELDGKTRFDIGMSFEDLKVEEFIGKKPDAEGPSVTGRIDGKMALSGALGDVKKRRASGQLRIENANLSRLPIPLGLLRVMHLTLPGEQPFSDGFVEYHMAGRKLVLTEIHLVGGSASSLVGSGTVDMKTNRLKLTFLTASSRVLPRIGSLDELLQGILREIVEVRVRGTLDKPEVEAVPLRSVRDVLDTILNPEKAQ